MANMENAKVENHQEKRMVTSAEAAKILRKLEEDKAVLLEKETKLRQYHAAVSEDPAELKPDYDFIKYQSEILAIDEKMRKIKHCINVFNSTTEVIDSMTIDEVLIYLPQLNSLKRKYYTMQSVAPKIRCSIVGSVIDYIYANYDPEVVKMCYEDTADIINRYQMALDTVNNTVEFEIPV